MNYSINLNITLDSKGVLNIEVACYSCSIDPLRFDAHHKKMIAHFSFFFHVDK